MNQLSVMVSTGNLGDNIIEKGSFYEGLKRDIGYFAADAGTADAGPTFLGADSPHNPIEWETHDLELLLLASRERGVPMIVGSCSTTGTDSAVDRYGSIIRKLAKKHGLRPFKMALIYCEINKDELLKRLEEKEIPPLGAEKSLTHEDIGRTDHITASMGVEQIIHALSQGADVIIAGRACDDAVIAAYPIYRGFPKGLSLHLGKAIECASLVCWPQMVKESVIGTITDDYFTLEPIHKNQRATPHSVAAHSMYERTNPFFQALPGGVLDMTNSVYEPVDERICRVRGSVFVPAPDNVYKVKLEGAGVVGQRVYHFVGIRDPYAIENIDLVLKETREKVYENFPQEENNYQLYFHIFGRNGVMREREIVKITASHELGVFIEVVSKDVELATSIAKCAKFRFFYMSYPGQKNSSGGSVALLTDEPLYTKNACCQWTIDHLLSLDDPLDDRIFRYSFEMVG